MLEAGGYYNESDFNQLELWAYEKLYRAGGVAQTANGSMVLMTGSNLGGGSTVNWTNCVRTHDWVRDEWEHEHGLEGLTGKDYDEHLDAVWKRLQVNDKCSDFNGPTLRMQEGCEKLGWDFRTITRNADRDRYDADLAGLLGFGDVTGAKLGTLKTYLQDAADAGARFVVDCRVERILVENGRAAGVEGTYRDADGARATRRRARADRRASPPARSTHPRVLLRIGHRRACRRRLPAAAPGDRDARGLRRAAEGLVGRTADGAQRGVRRPRRRLRLPDRDVARQPVGDRLGGPVGDRPASTRSTWRRAP